MKAKVSILSVLKRTEDVISFQLSKPHGFVFLPGQYLLVSVQKDGTLLTKPLSISSSPMENFLEITKRITGHEFSNAMIKLQVGDGVYIDGPYGSFTFEGEYSKVAMLAGGIGITPFMSMINYCTQMQIPSDIILLYGNRSEENIPFFHELNTAAKKNKNFKVVHTLSRAGDSWMGRRGRLNSEIIRKEIQDYIGRIFYLSGPPGFVIDCTQHLKSLGISEEKIKTESFVGY